MTNRHLHTLIKRLMAVALGLGAAGAGLGANPPSPKIHQEKALRIDRYGDPLPQGAVARLGTIRLRAIGARVGLSPDGKTIVTIAGEQIPLLKFFDADTGKLRERLELPGASPTEPMKTSLSSDGRLLGVHCS